MIHHIREHPENSCIQNGWADNRFDSKNVSFLDGYFWFIIRDLFCICFAMVNKCEELLNIRTLRSSIFQLTKNLKYALVFIEIDIIKYFYSVPSRIRWQSCKVEDTHA